MQPTAPDPALTVRPASAADAAQVAATLAEAFRDDPVMAWLFPNERRRPELARRYFETITRGVYLPHREVYLAEDAGAALWLPPGVRADLLPGLTGLSLLWQMLLACGFSGLSRASTLSKALAQHHPRQPHFYLHAVGVRTSRQGQGVGSALIRHVTERCDRAGLLAYLENSNARNRPLYENHGFRVVGEWTAPGGPTIWFMERPTQAKA